MSLKRFLSSVLKSYKKIKTVSFSEKNLLYTNILLSIGTSTTGDLLLQKYELYSKDIEKIDLSRTVHMGFSGCIAGIICHYWYIYLDSVVTGRSIDMLIKKLILDQCICSPIVILSFIATIAIFEEHPLDNFTEEVKEKFWTLYKAEWVVWPPAQLINFYMLPTKYRVAYDNFVSLGYDIYTSHVKHKVKKEN